MYVSIVRGTGWDGIVVHTALLSHQKSLLLEGSYETLQVGTVPLPCRKRSRRNPEFKRTPKNGATDGAANFETLEPYVPGHCGVPYDAHCQ